jgi:hypothetical protein
MVRTSPQASPFSLVTTFNGIFQPFELRTETRLIQPAVINWRPGDAKIPENGFSWTKSSHKLLSRGKWFYAPLVRLYHLKKIYNLPDLQYFTADRMSLLSPQFKWLDNTFKYVRMLRDLVQRALDPYHSNTDGANFFSPSH